jgi:ribosomal protein L40E
MAGFNPYPKTPKPDVRPFPAQAQQEPRRIGPWAYENERPDGDAPTERVRTGKTERLICRKCGDTSPIGAHYCIMCGSRL